MSGPWGRVYPGTYQTGDATLYKSPPGKLVVELMLAGNPSGPASAHYAPFTPSGTTGQLAIGGTNVSSGAFVSALYHSDYQGTLTLSTAERTNVLPRSLLEGSGTTPTGWTYYTDTGTSAPASSTWSPGDGAQAWTITSTTGQNFIYQNFSVAANTVYCLSVLVESVTGSITAQNALYSGNFPAGASLEFPVCPANPSGGNFGIVQAGLLVALLRVAGTAGAATVYLGVGCAASNTGTVKFSRPQIEVGTQRTGFIPTSATTASITDYSYNDSGAVTLGQTATGAYSWSGSGLLASGGTTLTPTEGALTLAGQTPSLTRALLPVAAALVLTGQVPSLTKILTPQTGSLSLAGQQPTITKGTVLTPGTGSLSLTGQVPSLSQGLTPSPGSLATSGQSPTLTQGKTPASGSLSIAGQAPALTQGIIPTPGALTLAGQQPSLSAATGLTPTPGALVLAGQAPGLTIGITPQTGALGLSGQAPSLTRGLTPAPGALAFSGQVPALTRGLQAATGALALAGQPPSLTRGLSPSTGALALTGGAPALTRGITPGTAALALAGQAATLTQGITVTTGALTLAGGTPSITIWSPYELDDSLVTVFLTHLAVAYVPDLLAVVPAPVHLVTAHLDYLVEVL